jgi:hypothetical protein
MTTTVASRQERRGESDLGIVMEPEERDEGFGAAYSKFDGEAAVDQDVTIDVMFATSPTQRESTSASLRACS